MRAISPTARAATATDDWLQCDSLAWRCVARYLHRARRRGPKRPRFASFRRRTPACSEVTSPVACNRAPTIGPSKTARRSAERTVALEVSNYAVGHMHAALAVE